jgi:hypothetical protein
MSKAKAVTKEEWGNACWYLFHALAEKLSPDQENEIPALFNEIKNICSNLPCPDCSKHALSMLAAIRPNSIKTKDDLIYFLLEFHNSVNSRLKKPIFSREECLEKYKKAVLTNIVNHFIQVFDKPTGIDHYMMYTAQRKNCLKRFISYIHENANKFNF